MEFFVILRGEGKVVGSGCGAGGEGTRGVEGSGKGNNESVPAVLSGEDDVVRGQGGVSVEGQRLEGWGMGPGAGVGEGISVSSDVRADIRTDMGTDGQPSHFIVVLDIVEFCLDGLLENKGVSIVIHD